jgi:hypothetical protein
MKPIIKQVTGLSVLFVFVFIFSRYSHLIYSEYFLVGWVSSFVFQILGLLSLEIYAWLSQKGRKNINIFIDGNMRDISTIVFASFLSSLVTTAMKRASIATIWVVLIGLSIWGLIIKIFSTDALFRSSHLDSPST